MPQPKIYRVAEITRLIKTVIEDEVGEVWIEGEISNLRKPTSGHCYFTLKDDSAQIAAVMFRGNQRGLRFQPADGLMIRVFGQVSVYEKSGQYQVIVRQMEMSGQGALQAAFEAQLEGVFSDLEGAHRWFSQLVRRGTGPSSGADKSVRAPNRRGRSPGRGA